MSARELDSALRRTITSAGGTPIEGKLLGDGVLATFDAASAAVACAQACHAAAQLEGIDEPQRLFAVRTEEPPVGNNASG